MLTLPVWGWARRAISALATDPAQNASDPTWAVPPSDAGVARGGCASGRVPAPLLRCLRLLVPAGAQGGAGPIVLAIAVAQSPSPPGHRRLDVPARLGAGGFAAAERARLRSGGRG
jgi:hypothetical protein